MAESEFDENLVKHDISAGGDHDQGYGYYETIHYNGVKLIVHEDMYWDMDQTSTLGVEWVEGKRKFKISNEDGGKKIGLVTDKVYDIIELYETKKNNN